VTPAGTVTYPVSFEQETIWTADQMSDGPSRYLESWALRLAGPLDHDALRAALAGLVARHEALRTTLAILDDELVQVVPARLDIGLVRRSCPPGRRDAELMTIVSEPLRAAPLRATLLELSPAEHVLVVQLHHAVIDDWALAIIDQEFQELYTARAENRAPRLAPAARLGDYAAAQRAAGLNASAIAYWRDRLKQPPAPGAPPADRPRPAVPSWRAAQIGFEIGDETSRRVRQACRATRTTPFTVFTATLSALLCWYAGTSEVIVGTPVSRRGADTEPLIGCLTDIVPLRQEVRARDPFSAHASVVHRVIWEAIAHKDVPYGQLVTRAARRAGRGGAPLCQTVLVVDDVRQSILRLPGLVTERLYIPSGRAKFDLCLTIVAARGGYRGQLDYAVDLYDRATAGRFASRFAVLLAAVTAEPSASLASALETLVEAPGE
jgi:hypothetical protein